MQFIAKILNKVLILSILYSFLLVSCSSKDPFPHLKKGTLELPGGIKIITHIAEDPKSQTKGLSGLKDSDFSDDQAMIFFYHTNSSKQFWMPDTHFNLDIFFLDKDYKVLAVDRDVPHHPGMEEPPRIPRTRVVYSRHVLELKSSSPHAKSILVGQTLNFKINSQEK